MIQVSDEAQPTATSRARLAGITRIPGLLPAAAIALFWGIICWLWLTAHTGAANNVDPATGTTVSELAQVDSQDITAALATMNGSDAFLSQFKQGKIGCPQPLAWIAVSRAAGDPDATIRLRSGDYFSPVFSLSASPMRIAIPYPGPYDAGHGELAAIDIGGTASVALMPPWAVATQNDEALRAVSWHPGTSCTLPNG